MAIGPAQLFARGRIGLAMSLQVRDYAPLARHRENEHHVIRPSVVAREAHPVTATDPGFVIVTSHVFHISDDVTFILE